MFIEIDGTEIYKTCNTEDNNQTDNILLLLLLSIVRTTDLIWETSMNIPT